MRTFFLAGLVCVLLGMAYKASPSVAESMLQTRLALRDRFGFNLVLQRGDIDDYDVGRLRAGWYLDYGISLTPSRAGMEYVQTVHVSGRRFSPDLSTLGTIVQNNLGSIWIIGNEPDSVWQANSLPDDYAVVYHELYTFIKSRDPSARITIGGIVQPTPLRLQYLDLVVEAYRSRYGGMIPVDVWNIHNMILREERGSWGAEIPPGIDADRGRLYEIQDNDNIEIFRQHVVAFREWMLRNGQRNRPLIISEYGVLMPELYGFDHERVKRFMYQTFDYLLTATDEELGDPADGNRLVQRWAWYSLNDQPYDPETGQGFNGNLFDPVSREITPLGLDYSGYLLRHIAGYNSYLPLIHAQNSSHPPGRKALQ